MKESLAKVTHFTARAFVLIAVVLMFLLTASTAFADTSQGKAGNALTISRENDEQDTVVSKRIVANGVYEIRFKADAGFVVELEGANTASGANIRLAARNRTSAQRWAITWERDGFYSIKNASCAMAMEVAGGSTKLRANIQSNKHNNSDVQRWAIVKNKNGSYTFINKHTKLALDAAGGRAKTGTNMQSYTVTHRKSQQFTLKSARALDQAVAYTFRSVAQPSRVIDVPNATQEVGARIRAYTAKDLMDQKFVVIYLSDGTYAIRALCSGRYLAEENGKVVQVRKGNEDSAHWNIFVRGSGFVFKNAASGKILTIGKANSTGAAALTCTSWAGKSTQLFLTEKVAPVADGYYTLLSAANTSLAVSVKDGARTNGANIRLFKKNGTSAQKFLVTSLGKDWYRITNASNGRALDVAKGSAKAGANVQQYASNNTKAQRWKIILTKDGTFRIVNAISSKVFGAETVKPSHETNLRVFNYTNRANQRFHLVPTSMSGEVVDMNVPCYWQKPELPTGCESVAMTNALRYYGFGLGKTTIAYHYLPWSGTDFVYSFMGDPRTNSGAAVMAPGLTNAANRYLKAQGSPLRAKNITGTSFDNLYTYLRQGTPVVVWSTMYFGNVGAATAWGHGYTMHQNTHTVVLSGYNPKTNQVRVSDSLSGQVWRSAGRFKQIYNAMGKQAIIIR